VKELETSEGLGPADSPAWQAALRQVLTPAQVAAWTGAQANRKKEAEEALTNYLARVAAQEKQQELSQINPEVAEIEKALNLPPDRAAKLKALAESVATDFGNSARPEAQKYLMALSAAQRKSVVEGGGVVLVSSPDTEPWEKALGQVLTGQELDRIKQMKEAATELRAEAAGKLLVALMDEKIRFTAAQRTQIEPIAERVVAIQPDLLADRPTDMYFNYSPVTFYLAASRAGEEEIKAILDPVQYGRWQKLCAKRDDPNGGMMVNNNPIPLPAAGTANNRAPAPEPEAVERAISDYLSDKSEAERENLEEERVLMAEDIARVAKPPPERVARLQLAARGDAEEALLAWNDSVDQIVRRDVAGATPENVTQKLDGIPGYQIENNTGRRGGDANPTDANSAWDKTVKEALTPDQLNAWREATDERSQYQQDAIAAWITAGFDEEFGLAPEQWSKMESKLEKPIKEYGDCFDGVIQISNSSAWYLNCNTFFLPLAGLTNEEMKATVSPEVFEQWRRSNWYDNAHSWWSNILMIKQQKQATGIGNVRL
jgi:hypothetical protein